MNNIFANSTKAEIERFYKKIANNIKVQREKKRLTQLELALEIGIKSVAFYSNCENGRYGKHFNLEHIYKISKALDIEICELFR